MIRSKSYTEQPFTKEELNVLKCASLIEPSDRHYDAIRYAVIYHRHNAPKVVFRFPNGFGASVVRRFDYPGQTPTFDMFFVGQSGFVDMTTPWGSWRASYKSKTVLEELDSIEKMPPPLKST